MKLALSGLIFLAFLACRDSKTIRIRFDSAEKVKKGDVVILQNARIGAVRRVKQRTDASAVVIILPDRPVDLPRGTEFLLSYDIFGTPFISIEPSKDERLLDLKEVQKGTVRDFSGTKQN